MKPDPCRFCRLYASSVGVFAALIGVVTTLSYALSASEALRDYTSRFLTHDVVRSTAPAASGSALLLALVLWSHPLSMPELQEQRRRILWRACALALPGFLVAASVAIACGLLVLLVGFGQPRSIVRSGLGSLDGWDLGNGARATVLDTILIVFLAYRYLVRLHAGGMSLPQKLIVVVTVTVGLRASVGLVFASLLSG